MAEAHIRIDEGIKRTRKSVPRRRDPDSGQVQAIPPDLDPRDVLEMYLSEQTTSQIAKHFGVRRKSLVGWLRQVAPDQWRHVQIVRASVRKEDGDDQIEGAEDALSLARAREMIRSAQWDLERLDSGNYGQKQHVTVEHTGDLGDRLMRAEQRVIEGECTQVTRDEDKPLNDKA